MFALLTTMHDRVINRTRMIYSIPAPASGLKRHRVLHFTVDRTRQSSLENLTEVYVVYTRHKITKALRFCLLYHRIA